MSVMSGNGANEVTDDVFLIYDVSDEALEKAGAFTLAFCSGFDTCPS
jgi:hypothetical protein